MAERGEAMEAAPNANPRREPPPIPANYVSLRQLQELRLKEKEQEEKRRREEESAAAKRAATLKAEEADITAKAKRAAALRAEMKGRAVSREAFCGAMERRRGGQAQGRGHQWVAVAHPAPAATRLPTPTCGEVAAGERESVVGGDCGKKGPDDAPDNAPYPHGGRKAWGKGKGKKKASSCHTVGEPGNLVVAAPAASNGGKPASKAEVGKPSGDQTAESRSSCGPGELAKAAVASSRGHLTRKGRKGAGGRSAETSLGDAPAKTAGPSSSRGVKWDSTGKPKPAAPRRVDAGTVGDSPEGKKAATAQVPPFSAADGSSQPTSGGGLRKTIEAKPEGLVEGLRRQPVVEVQTVTEQKPRVARRSAKPCRGRGRGNGAAEPHGRAWVPKAAAASGSSAGVGL